MGRPRSPHDFDEDALGRWWDAFEEALAGSGDDQVDELLDALSVLPGCPPGERAFARAAVAWTREGSATARPHLVEAVQVQPTHADARHALALACEEAGDEDEMRRQFLAVLRLDAAADVDVELETPSAHEFIRREAAAVLDSLPDTFRERLANVPVVLESRPAIHLVESGFDPRSLGLFEGRSDGEDSGSELPTRIVLYAANLLAAFEDDDVLAEQVEITILHEVAHFFGLEEDEVAALGLE